MRDTVAVSVARDAGAGFHRHNFSNRTARSQNCSQRAAVSGVISPILRRCRAKQLVRVGVPVTAHYSSYSGMTGCLPGCYTAGAAPIPTYCRAGYVRTRHSLSCQGVAGHLPAAIRCEIVAKLAPGTLRGGGTSWPGHPAEGLKSCKGIHMLALGGERSVVWLRALLPQTAHGAAHMDRMPAPNAKIG